MYVNAHKSWIIIYLQVWDLTTALELAHKLPGKKMYFYVFSEQYAHNIIILVFFSSYYFIKLVSYVGPW